MPEILTDNEINNCRHNIVPFWQGCDDCPHRKRCDQLVGEEWAVEMGLHPSELTWRERMHEVNQEWAK